MIPNVCNSMRTQGCNAPLHEYKLIKNFSRSNQDIFSNTSKLIRNKSLQKEISLPEAHVKEINRSFRDVYIKIFTVATFNVFIFFKQCEIYRKKEKIVQRVSIYPTLSPRLLFPCEMHCTGLTL